MESIHLFIFVLFMSMMSIAQLLDDVPFLEALEEGQ